MAEPIEDTRTIGERMTALENVIKKATMRLEEHIDDSSIRAIGAVEWAKIMIRMAFGVVIVQIIAFAVGVVGLMLLYLIAVATRR
jgi:hypothetical protein